MFVIVCDCPSPYISSPRVRCPNAIENAQLAYASHPLLYIIRLKSSPKARCARHVLDLLELDAHLHNAISYHPRIQTHGPSQDVLCLGARIEAHNEVVTNVMCGL